MDEGSLRADDDEVDAERPRKAEQTLSVLATDGMALAELRDPRISRRRVELGQRRRLTELPCERMLASPGADEENAHAPSLVVSPESPVLLGRAKTEQRQDTGSLDIRRYRGDRGRRDAKRLQPAKRGRTSRRDH